MGGPNTLEGPKRVKASKAATKSWKKGWYDLKPPNFVTQVEIKLKWLTFVHCFYSSKNGRSSLWPLASGLVTHSFDLERLFPAWTARSMNVSWVLLELAADWLKFREANSFPVLPLIFYNCYNCFSGTAWERRESGTKLIRNQAETRGVPPV